MAYVKTNTFVDGSTLDADDVNDNDEGLKLYLNQTIVVGDYSTQAFGTEEIQLGDYQPITNEYRFVSGIATGNATDREQINRAYWTATIKKGRLTSNTLPVWTSLYHTSPAVYLEQDANILITFGASTTSAANEVALNAFWDTPLKLAYTKDDDNQLIFVEQSRSYSFEEAPMGTLQAGNVFPFGATTAPSSTNDEVPEVQRGLGRWIGWSAIIKDLTPGHYKFSVYANAHVEEGFLSARQFKAEVFYK